MKWTNGRTASRVVQLILSVMLFTIALGAMRYVQATENSSTPVTTITGMPQSAVEELSKVLGH